MHEWVSKLAMGLQPTARIRMLPPLCGCTDFFKVVYVTERYGRTTTVNNSVCLLTLRSDAFTKMFHPDTGRPLDSPSGMDHVVLDRARVVSGVFIGYQAAAVKVAVDKYKSGAAKLESQLAVHNMLSFQYEIGELARADDAGARGMNGCCKGIHGFVSKTAALRYAAQMAVASSSFVDNSITDQGKLLDESDLVATDVTGLAEFDNEAIASWWPWNRQFAPSESCPCCGSPLALSRKYKVMDCGHVLCQQCRLLTDETKLCGICSRHVSRMLDIDKLPW